MKRKNTRIIAYEKDLKTFSQLMTHTYENMVKSILKGRLDFFLTKPSFTWFESRMFQEVMGHWQSQSHL